MLETWKKTKRIDKTIILRITFLKLPSQCQQILYAIKLTQILYRKAYDLMSIFIAYKYYIVVYKYVKYRVNDKYVSEAYYFGSDVENKATYCESITKARCAEWYIY